MHKLKPLLLLVGLAVLALFWQARHHASPAVAGATPIAQGAHAARAQTGAPASLPAFLPPEAADTLARIADGGPFEHREDGSVFGNREGLLPQRPRGYYHEYTVETPGASTRGARRIVTGGTPPSEYWYSDDHYRSFRRFQPSR